MSERLFGTDGIRGRAGDEPLTTTTLERLGRILGVRLAAAAGGSGAVVVGHDGRESGETLAAALVAGLCSQGLDCDIVGLAPTPCIAFLTARGDYCCGIVVSASHNPAADNGVKILGAGGAKLPDEEELALEEALRSGVAPPPAERRGRARRAKALVGDYVAWLRSEAFPDLDLRGWKVAMDCANGACSQIGPRVLRAFGAEPLCIHNRPDGRNINAACGAVHPAEVARATVDLGADVGLTVDGDGDRGLLADSRGRILDGDAILAGLGRDYAARGRLPGRKVVATVMSNLALERTLAAAGVELVRVPVGDRHVAAAMRAEGLALGGEKSGHILFGADHDYRGDGLYTFLRCAQAMQEAGIPPADFAADYRDLPQRLDNLPVRRRCRLEDLPRLQAEVQAVQEALAGRGRIVVRFSGTEACLRLMAEAETQELVDEALARLRAAAAEEGILA